MWVLDYLPDLESDFSVFHRIEDIYEMPAVRFFQFAERVSAYKGVMRLHVEIESMKQQQQAQPIGMGKSNQKVVNSLAEMPIARGERVVVR